MSPTVDLSDVPDLPVPHEVLRELSDRSERHGIEMFVLGAAARDLVVHAPTERSKRATVDVDVAIAVDHVQFERFTSGWERVRGSEHKFKVLGVEVDVVPFGPMELRRTVELNDGHRLDVNGLAEAASTAVLVVLSGGLELKVASLPAQAALKILAWRDRHHDNPKDGQDLGEILRAAAEGRHAEETWDDEQALDWADYDIYTASAYRAGRAAGAPFAEGDGIQVLAVLEDEPLVEKLARRMGGVGSRELLSAFAEGFRVGLRGL